MSDLTVRSDIADFRRALQELGGPITRRVVRSGVVAAARSGLPAVKAKAPVLAVPINTRSKQRRTGALREAIYVQRPKVSPGAASATISVRGKPYVRGKKSFDGAFYWRFLEGGWVPRGPGRKLRGGVRSRNVQRRRNAAAGARRVQYPFLAPGVRQAQPQIVQKFQDQVGRAIVREQEKLRR